MLLTNVDNPDVSDEMPEKTPESLAGGGCGRYWGGKPTIGLEMGRSPGWWKIIYTLIS